MSVILVLLALIFGFLFIWYKRWAKLYDYWKERGLIHDKPYHLVGNMLDNVLKRKTMGEVYYEIASKYKNHKYIGCYSFISADLMITDPEDVQIVFFKEFSHFIDRTPEVKQHRFMDKHLFLLTGAEWKGVRNKISPAFSSGKLKGMFPLMLKSYENTSKFIDSSQKTDETLNLKDIIEMFIINVSATTIFGIDPSKLTDPDSEFKKIVDKTSKLTFFQFVAMTTTLLFPNIAERFNISPVDKNIEKYFIDLILNTFKERVESGVSRDDIIQQLLQLKQNGKIEVSQWINEDTDDFGSDDSLTVTETIEITDSLLVSQGFIFLMAGLDPLRSTLNMLILEIAKNKEIQDKLRENVESKIKQHGGMTWQAVKEMDYLDWCFSETLRLYPAAEFGGRLCVKEYTFPEGQTVEKGQRVVVPIMYFHMNPNYFPEPNKFMPERFELPPQPGAYMPFGLGPRMCIARRFALQEMKVLVANLILDYDLSLDSKTKLPVEIDKWFFLRRISSPIHIKFSKRKQY